MRMALLEVLLSQVTPVSRMLKGFVRVLLIIFPWGGVGLGLRQAAGGLEERQAQVGQAPVGGQD